MRKQNDKWNILGRRMLVLLLLCGLLMPILTQTNAATVTYEYKWIKSDAGLPTDDQWHDFFIAWEDTEEDNKYWFTDYHWYTADGDNNIDVGGSHWMEYKAASALPDHTSDSFSSKECLGHLQIKHVGWTYTENNAPTYLIRVAKMNGGYSYFTKYEPTDNEADADAFTFVDKGDVFHIFVSIPGKADRYLTRDGQYLETTESTSYGGGEYWRPLRVYQRTFTVDNTVQEDIGDPIGKVTLYEYSWVNTFDELMALTDSKQWQNVMLAWEDATDKGTTNPHKVWYTKEVWYEGGAPNYKNGSRNSWYYYSNDYLGSDGYGSPYAESFLLPSQAGHVQMKFVDWDDENPVHGITDWGDDPFDSPVFQFRFDVGHGRYVYIGNNGFYDDAEYVENYTVQLRLGRKDSEDLYGSVWLINNMWNGDELFCRNGNYFTIGNWSGSDYWEFPFRIYTYRPVEYDAIVKSFTIGKGATYSIDKQLIVDDDVVITVEDGGVLAVDDEMLNNGKIVVKNGGTVIVYEGGCIMSYDQNALGEIRLDGGNLVIMDGAKVICDQSEGALLAENGATILNRGLLMVGNRLLMYKNTVLKNESDAMLLVGGRIARERGSIGTLTFEEIASRVENKKFGYLLSKNARIINKGIISEPEKVTIVYSADAQSSTTHVGNGCVAKRKA